MANQNWVIRYIQIPKRSQEICRLFHLSECRVLRCKVQKTDNNQSFTALRRKHLEMQKILTGKQQGIK